MKDEKQKDPRYLERDELERELVRRDKQALISDCLRIFDTNTMLFEQLQAANSAGVQGVKDLKQAMARIAELERMTIWQKINQRLEYGINKIRSRRKSFNYPVK